MLKPDYPLRTRRLLLRPYEAGDLDAVHDIQSRVDVTRYLYWGPRDRDAAGVSLGKKMRSTALEAEGDDITLAVVLPGTGELIGDVMLVWTSRPHRQGEVGYVFHPDHGGHGYATEAAAEMLRLGFDELGLHRIFGRIDARNTRSARVLTRLGMRREAHFEQNEIVKGEWTDEEVYAILEHEWARRPDVRGDR